MLDLCLVGGLGRMGKALAVMVEADSGVRIVSVWETAYAIGETEDYGRATGYSKNPVLVTASGADAVRPCRVVVDFSLPQAFPDVVRVCEELAKPLVTGTTGIEGKDTVLASLARKVAVVSAPSMAAGVTAMAHLADAAAGEVGRGADIEIVEAHHRGKRDVPSGTALELARVISARAGKRVVVGRAQGPAARSDELVIHSLRVGDVPGTHTVVFSLRGETLEITHTAQSRDCFAAGALRAARFVAEVAPGLYGMSDVLAAG
jgi:4-hydroxy-tetrahydrodipicolinate reductase